MDYHGTLHIYSPALWHDDAWIAGTPDALEALRDAINVALASGDGACKSFAADGEGFAAIVLRVDEAVAVTLRVPYTDDVAKDAGEYGRHPSEIIIGSGRYRDLGISGS